MLECKGKTGVLASKAVTDFAIPVQAIFNEAENIKALQQIIQS